MIPPEQVAREFAQRFGSAPAGICCAPGRVNLIGEHIDYAGGCVLPMAIRLGVTCAFTPGHDEQLRLLSDAFGGNASLTFSDEGESNPPHAALTLNLCKAHGLAGGSLLVMSDLPIGKGLSSSAAFCIAVHGSILAATGSSSSFSRHDWCRACQNAEQRVLGVDCGLMDQYASVFGRAGHALLLDTLALSIEYVPMPSQSASLVVIDSGQTRRLATAGYNERRKELSEALQLLTDDFGAGASLRSTPFVDLLSSIDKMPILLGKRLRHAATEQRRVEQFVDAMAASNLPLMGELLSMSHRSLSSDYEVSTQEIDLLCDLVSAEAGVYGARIMGGGFGGSVIALLANGASIDGALVSYTEQTNLQCSRMPVLSGDGARLYRLASSSNQIEELPID